MRRLVGVIWVVAGCTVPPLTIEGKACFGDGECPNPYQCVALEAGGSICTTGCPPASACAPTEGRACSSSNACPSPYQCVRRGPMASTCTLACPAGVPFEPFEVNCTDALDNDCDGRVGVSRDVVLIDAPAEQPSWAFVSDGGYAAVYVRSQQLQFQRFDHALSPVGDPLPISEPTSAASEPLLVPITASTFGVVWLDKGAPDAGSLTRVMFARLGLTGNAPTPRTLGAGNVQGRPRAAYSRKVGSLLVLWIEGSTAHSISLLSDGTPIGPRSPFPRDGGVLTGVTQLDVTDRVKSSFAAGFAAAWFQPSVPERPHFMFVDREGDRLVGPVEMNGVGQLGNVRAGNAELSGVDLTFFVWTEGVAGDSAIWGRSSLINATHFKLAGSTAGAASYSDLELAISTDNPAFNYIDVGAITGDGAARVVVSKLLPGASAPSSGKLQVEMKADGRAPAIAIGGGRHAFAYQADAGSGTRQIRAQLHCNP